MPRRACWTLTTSGPTWNLAPPPVIENWIVSVESAVIVADMSRVAVLIERVFPSPLALKPLTEASMSVPVSRVALRLSSNVPEEPSLITPTETYASDPYSEESSSSVPALSVAVTPKASETRLMAEATALTLVYCSKLNTWAPSSPANSKTTLSWSTPPPVYWVLAVAAVSPEPVSPLMVVLASSSEVSTVAVKDAFAMASICVSMALSAVESASSIVITSVLASSS